jgi:site-specific DNA-methyltransferase (adenine-specific)
MVRRMVKATATSAFGVGRRESHDASGFYDRFEPPELSGDDLVEPLEGLSQGEAACIRADARRMVLPDGDPLPEHSVALVVTSPPYFSGKEYEQALGSGHIPGSYLEYLGMLREVFDECKRVLEPGGRIAVNVANLGRKPYRSLSADVIRILQDDLRLLLRGEVIWRKAEGASGSCAWGSFRSASNPVLRDVTERVIIASKGRFDRAKTSRRRQELGLPHTGGIATDEFMEATLDVWAIPPERASRVGHPAPFPVELPQRLIELYTYRDDLVVDPFMGSGSTLAAAIRTNRRYLGYDTDAGYVAIASRRVKDELRRRSSLRVVGSPTGEAPPCPAPPPTPVKAAPAFAADLLEQSGFRILQRNARPRGLGLVISYVATDGAGVPWYFDVTGAFTTTAAGLARTDTLWRTLGRAGVLARMGKSPLVLLTSHLPRPRSQGDLAMRAAGPGLVFDALEMLAVEQTDRLRRYAAGGHDRAPAVGYWAAVDIAGI